MTRIIRRETRRRGVFGWLFLLIFIGFNLFMAFWFFTGLGAAGSGYGELGSDAEKAGAVIGTTIGATFIVIIWAAGATITGLFAFLTRGKLTIIEERDDEMDVRQVQNRQEPHL